MAKKGKAREVEFADRSLTSSQAKFLAREARIEVSDLENVKVGDLAGKLDRLIDPQWFLRRRICGRVVQENPVTGELEGVPGAVVEVEDTDCSLVFRRVGRFHWLYPLGCTRETIATAVTDDCGYFCVWVPRWLSERILTWRKERICFEIERPRFDDLFEPPVVGPPSPDPEFVFDPIVDPAVVSRFDDLRSDLSFAAKAERRDLSLARPLRLPLPGAPQEFDPVGYTPHPDDPDFGRGFGPYLVKCRDVYIPEWKTVIDVPDITFKVTQEVDGTDRTVYSEGYFEVRWNDGGSGDVLLEANGTAATSDVCRETGHVCVDVAEIQEAGEMPLEPGYHDDTTGYGLRVNRPGDGVTGPTGFDAPDAEAPIANQLWLRGCVHIDGANVYRVLTRAPGGTATPITNVSFAVTLEPSGVAIQSTDADGWIPIRNDLTITSQSKIIPWPTLRFANGVYDVWVETGNRATATSPVSGNADGPKRRFALDNSYPGFSDFTVQYRVGTPTDLGTQTFQPLALGACPQITRGPGEDVEIRLAWRAQASHLRSARVDLGSCGTGATVLAPPATDRRFWWATAGATDTGAKVASWVIPSTSAPGCYPLSRVAVSRAYNPSRIQETDYYGPDDVRRVHGSWSISIVDG